MATMSGPYRTERETYVEPMCREVSELHRANRVRSGDPARLVRDTVLRHLVATCEAAGVELGDYDLRILAWLARGETSAAQVVLDLIGRAHAAGQVSDSPSPSEEGRS
jgi:hypothetical protein